MNQIDPTVSPYALNRNGGSTASQAQILPQLGLVEVKSSPPLYRSLIHKRLLPMNPTQKAEYLRFLYPRDLQRLAQAIECCSQRQIRLYQIPSALFPLADTPLGAAIRKEFQSEFNRIGDRAHNIGLRLVMHSPPYVVLNSDSPGIIESSIKLLAAQAQIMDDLGQERSPWATIKISGGKSDRAKRLVETILKLPVAIRSRLALANDEYAYSAQATLEICRQAGIPMVFNAHHHVIYEQLETYEHESLARMLIAAGTTWTVPQHQLVTIANGQEYFTDFRSSDFIEVFPSAFRQVSWIEVEAKDASAIEKLQQEWLAHTVTSVAG